MITNILIFSVVLTSVLANKLPEDFKKCYRNEPNFDGCLTAAVQDALKKLSNGGLTFRHVFIVVTWGLPNLDLVPLEPLTIPRLSVKRGSGPVSVDLKFENLKIRGITDSIVNSTNTDLKNLKIESRNFGKQLVIDADYEVDGKALLLPVRGCGKSHITLANVDALVKFSGISRIKKGKTYMEIDHFDYKFSTTKMTLSLENLFNGDKTLSKAMNDVLNNNWQEVFRELKPSIEKALSSIFKDYTSRLYSRVPLDEIYPISRTQ